MAAPPDPVTPGLLDLLTVAALGEPIDDVSAVDSSAWDAPSEPVAGARGPRPAAAEATRSGASIADATGSRRLWVEVESRRPEVEAPVQAPL